MKTFEVRQQVRTVLQSRLEVVFQSPYERAARISYESLVSGHPGQYFELIAVVHEEECLAFTKKDPPDEPKP